MMWTIPGTVLQAERSEAEHIPQQMEALFFGGGITLSQVTAITGLEAYTVQNWVKRGFLTSPKGKRYTLRQFCRILNINMLKSVLPMERICSLLTYINGQLDNESDDLIDDSVLYFMLVRLASQCRQINSVAQRDQLISEIMQSYQEPIPGANARVEKVLRVMFTAWAAAQLRLEAENLLQDLDTN